MIGAIIGDVAEGYPAMEAGLESGDLVISIDGENINSWDKGLIKLQTSQGSEVVFEVQKKDGTVSKYSVTPLKEIDEKGNTSYKYGIATSYDKEYGFVKSLSYAFNKTISLFTLSYLSGSIKLMLL